MKPISKIPVLLLFLSLVFSSPLLAQNLNLLWSRVEFGINLGLTNLFCQDIDADGRQEVIFNGGDQSGGQHVFVAHYTGDNLVVEWSSHLFEGNPIVAISLANTDQDADTEIYILLQDGTLEVYDGISKNLVATYQTNVDGGRAAAVADFDHNGHTEIVVLTEYKIAVFDLNTQQIDWENANVTGTVLATGDVDGDGTLEVVVSSQQWNGGTGYILNAATGTIEWQYLGGFGRKLGLADTNQDGTLEIIGLNTSQITIFDAVNHSPLTQFSPSTDLGSLLVTDIEGDGHAEIITGDQQVGEIRAYNAETQQLLWEFINPDYGITNIALGDPDDDGVNEVIFGSGAAVSGADRLYFYNVTTLQQEYKTIDLDGPFFFDATDINDDETIDFVVASSASNSNYDAGHILAYNSSTLDLEWDQKSEGFGVIQRMILTQLRDDHQSEIITANNGITIYDATSRQVLFQGGLNSAFDIQQADLDGDGKLEIITADGDGRITAFGYDNNAFHQKWQSISYGTITALEVANTDADPTPEIIFVQPTGILQALDGKTKLLQWQIAVAPNSSAKLAVDDLDANGVNELIYAEDKNLHVYNCQNQQLLADHLNVTTNYIRAIEIANLDSTARKEILLYDTKLIILNSETFAVNWQSQPLGDNYFGFVSLVVKDLFDDQHVDVLVGTIAGVYQFSSAASIPDVVPPRIIKHFPAKNAQFQALNTVIKINFSENIDPNSLNTSNVIVRDGQGNILPVTLTFDTLLSQLNCQPITPLPALDTIRVTLTGNLADWSQNTLDGNDNGVGEGSPSDNYTWTFTTGSGNDNIGPAAINVNLLPAEAWPGIPVIVNATFSDFSIIATSGVANAEFFIGQIGNFGTGHPFDPADDFWGEVEENATGEIATDGFAGGDYTIFIHAQDLNGNWGTMVETTLHILAESNSNWPMYGQNAQHTNDNVNCDLEPPLKLKWTRTYNNRLLKPVTYANGHILAPMHQNDEFNAVLYCLDTISGADIWSHEFGNIFSINQAAYAYGRVYLQTCNNTPGTFLSALNLQDGALLWQSPFEAQWENYLSPTVANGSVFINGGTYGGIYSFDAISGQKIWNKPLLQFDGWTPAYYHNVTYSFAGGKLSAHNAVNGQEQWQKDLTFTWNGYTMNTAPVLDTTNHLVYTTSSNYLHAVNFDTHETIWFLSGTLGVTPALHEGKLYVVKSGKLEARNALTGVVSWTFNGDNQLSYPPAVAGDYIFVSSANHLYAVNLATGLKAWEFDGGGAITLADNLLFLTNPDNVLRAFEHGLTSATSDIANGAAHFSIQPNPLVEQAQIRFSLTNAAQVLVQVADVSGRVVATLSNDWKSAGEHTISWNPEGLAAGIYFCHLQAGEINTSRKIVVMAKGN